MALHMAMPWDACCYEGVPKALDIMELNPYCGYMYPLFHGGVSP